jgi:hypothetical protein
MTYNPTFLGTNGAWNITMRNLDATDYYSNIVVISALIVLVNNGLCLPDDGLVQNLYFENLSFGIKNDVLGNKIHGFALFLVAPHYRPINCVLNDFKFIDIHRVPIGPILAFWGTSMDNLLFSNLLVEN